TANDAVRTNVLAHAGPTRALAFVDALLPQDVISPSLDGVSGLVDVTVQVFNPRADRALNKYDRRAVVDGIGLANKLLNDPEDVLDGRYTNISMRVHAEAIALLAELEQVVDVEPRGTDEVLSERQAQEVRGFLNPTGTGAQGAGYYADLTNNKGFPTT